MNRTEFVIATAIILFVAFMLGWFAHWLVHRFMRVSQSDMSEIDHMAHQLHEAEEQRDQAVTFYQQREAEMTQPVDPDRGRTARRDGRAARCAPRG